MTSDHVEIPAGNGKMPAYLATPDGEGRSPALIVIHEIYGLTPHLEDLSRRFSAQGYVALAPNLFWNTGPVPDFSDRESFMRFRESMDDRVFLASLDAALQWLRARDDVDNRHVGIIGFCFGGYYAMLDAIHNADLAACVDFYGAPLAAETSERRPMSLLEGARNLKVPYMGLFGAEDQSIPVEQIRQLESVLQETGTPFVIRVFPGAGHAFFNDTGPRYVEEAAVEAWPMVLRFFAEYLGGNTQAQTS